MNRTCGVAVLLGYDGPLVQSVVLGQIGIFSVVLPDEITEDFGVDLATNVVVILEAVVYGLRLFALRT